MPVSLTGSAVALILYDVGEEIELELLSTILLPAPRRRLNFWSTAIPSCEFRHYDELLTRELEAGHKFLERGSPILRRWRLAREGARLQRLTIDVTELTERAENVSSSSATCSRPVSTAWRWPGSG
jgi:hypothetical protein